MNGVNLVILLGNIGQDPEIRYMQSGNAMVSFSVAVNRTFMKEGEKKTHTEWVNCIAWGKRAEFIAEYVKKGTVVHISGELTTRTWKDKEEKTRSRTQVTVNNIQPIGKGNGPKDGEKPEEPKDLPDITGEEDIPF